MIRPQSDTMFRSWEPPVHERHSADDQTYIRKVTARSWEIWFEGKLHSLHFTRESARIRIRRLKEHGIRTRWDILKDGDFLAHLPDSASIGPNEDHLRD